MPNVSSPRPVSDNETSNLSHQTTRGRSTDVINPKTSSREDQLSITPTAIQSDAPAQSSAITSSHQGQKGLSSRTNVAAIVVPVLVGILLLIFSIFAFRKRHKRREDAQTIVTDCVAEKRESSQVAQELHADTRQVWVPELEGDCHCKLREEPHSRLDWRKLRDAKVTDNGSMSNLTASTIQDVTPNSYF